MFLVISKQVVFICFESSCGQNCGIKHRLPTTNSGRGERFSNDIIAKAKMVVNLDQYNEYSWYTTQVS